MSNIDLITYDEAFMASFVDRWHMLRVSRPQSIAEHSFRVAILARKIAPEVFAAAKQELTVELREELLEYALLHDLDETMTGDTPGFVKQKYPAIREATDLFWRDRTPTEPDPRVKWLVKYADIVEGYIYYYSCGALGPTVPSARRDWALRNAISALEKHLISGLGVFESDDRHFFLARLYEAAIAKRFGIDATHG
jgi:hypothetical protein